MLGPLADVLSEAMVRSGGLAELCGEVFGEGRWEGGESALGGVLSLCAQCVGQALCGCSYGRTYTYNG